MNSTEGDASKANEGSGSEPEGKNLHESVAVGSAGSVKPRHWWSGGQKKNNSEGDASKANEGTGSEPEGKNLPVPLPLDDGVAQLYVLSDSSFFQRLNLFRSLQQTVLYERITVLPHDETHLRLGRLNTLRGFSEGDKRARRATIEEWNQVEEGIRSLTKYLTARQIWQVQLDQITGFLIYFPALLLAVSVVCLIGSITSSSGGSPVVFIGGYILWVMTTGGLGSAAFVYVNALSIQVDPTVNVLSTSLIRMRVLLGALFALMLALPFGLGSFYALSQSLISLKEPIDVQQGSLLLLPFILGFSTPLVLSILNRIVVSAQTLFGVQERLDGSRDVRQVQGLTTAEAARNASTPNSLVRVSSPSRRSVKGQTR